VFLDSFLFCSSGNEVNFAFKGISSFSERSVVTSARCFIRDKIDCRFLLAENSVYVIINKLEEMRDSILVHPLNKGAFVGVTFSLPFNRRSIEISIEGNSWGMQLVFRSARSFSGEVLENHLRVTGSVLETLVHGVVDVSEIN